MRTSIRQATVNPQHQRVVVGGLLVVITLAGIIAYANWFSFLMLIFLGAPGLLVLLDGIADA
jgi:hypothetical protein